MQGEMRGARNRATSQGGLELWARLQTVHGNQALAAAADHTGKCASNGNGNGND